MSAIYNAGKLKQLDGGLRAYALYASVHTADPTAAGTSEAAGGTIPYARKAVAFGAPAVVGGVPQMSHGAVTWDLPAGTFTHVAYWEVLTGGSPLCSDDLPTSQVISSSGSMTIVGGTIDLNG